MLMDGAFQDNPGLHKGDARSDKIARRNDASTIGVLGKSTGFLQCLCKIVCDGHHVAFETFTKMNRRQLCFGNRTYY